MNLKVSTANFKIYKNHNQIIYKQINKYEENETVKNKKYIIYFIYIESDFFKYPYISSILTLSNF